MRIHRVLPVLLLALAAAPAMALPGPGLPGVPDTATLDPGAAAAPQTRAAQSGEALRGTFRITAGSCAGAVSGSYFRMIQPGGNSESGPWVENSDSPCADKTYTPLRPGSDGGLISGAYQPQPAEPFDAGGNGTAARIVQPAAFFGVRFAVATNEADPQSGTAVTAPVVSRSGSTLSGDLRAVGVAWNRQHFNQGSPKPDGTTPGQTTPPSGTIEAATKAYALQWTSTIVGGPFNNFTGLWHLEGTFDGPLGSDTAPAQQETAPGAPATPGGSGGSAGSTPNTGPALPALTGIGALALAGALRRRHG